MLPPEEDSPIVAAKESSTSQRTSKVPSVSDGHIPVHTSVGRRNSWHSEVARIQTETVSHRKVSMTWKTTPSIPFRSRPSNNSKRQSSSSVVHTLGTHPTPVNCSFGWYKKSGKTSGIVHSNAGPGTPKVIRQSRVQSRQISTALQSARYDSRAVDVPIAGSDDQDAYEVKETSILMHCDDIEVPVTTMWPLRSIEEVRTLCEAVFEFLHKYPGYQLECHHRRPYGSTSDEQTEILLEIITGEKEKQTALSTEMITYMTAEQLKEIFESSLKEMKISLFKVCLLEVIRRLASLMEEAELDEDDETNPDGVSENKSIKSAKSDMKSGKVKSGKSEPKSDRPSEVPSIAKANSSTLRESVTDGSGRSAARGSYRFSKRLSTKKPRTTTEEIDEAEKLVECVKNLRGDLRAVPDALLGLVLSLIYTAVEFISEDTNYDCSESEEYFTFALRGFSVLESSPFFPQIFTASADLFMILCFVGCDADAVMEGGPAFDLICRQAKNPVGNILQVSGSAVECLVVICRKDKGIDILMADRNTWCEWIGHALQVLKDDSSARQPPDAWVFSMIVTALFRLWSIFAHEHDDCYLHFKENYEMLPIDFIFMTVNDERFDRDSEADIDIITSACSAFTGTMIDLETGEANYRCPKLEAILLDVVLHSHEDPDVMDSVCLCLALIASKSLIEKSGSSLLEAILRGVAALWDHPRFVTNAFHSLSIFLRTNPSLLEILTLEALELILSMMKENPFNETLQENGLFLIGLMARKVERNRSHLVQSGARQICKIAIGQFPESTVIREHSKYATSALARESGFLNLW